MLVFVDSDITMVTNGLNPLQQLWRQCCKRINPPIKPMQSDGYEYDGSMAELYLLHMWQNADQLAILLSSS